MPANSPYQCWLLDQSRYRTLSCSVWVCVREEQWQSIHNIKKMQDTSYDYPACSPGTASFGGLRLMALVQMSFIRVTQFQLLRCEYAQEDYNGFGSDRVIT